MKVEQINPSETYDFIRDLHYAQRIPSISFAFGLFIDSKKVAVLTIGKPASHSLCIGVCGKDYASQVYELNRLVALPDLPENAMSYFVGQVLRRLKSNSLILVSYADTGAGHHGYVYQATNWWYTGRTKTRTDKYTPSGKHSRHYTNEYAHLRKHRTAKHRYIYVPNKRLRKQVKRWLRYPIIEEYPKGDNENYVLGERMKTKITDRNTGETWFE